MEDLNYGDINDDVLNAMRKPHTPYLVAILVLAGIVGYAALVLVYQLQMGMGVTGLNRPVGWAVYIANFVFWVGIAHSGTLISAVLYLLRANWRDPVSRSSEAMTIFAVMTAGLFPLIHLGRLWVFYLYHALSVTTTALAEFSQSTHMGRLCSKHIFHCQPYFLGVGLIPDLAAARDRYAQTLGHDHIRTRIYGLLALGWTGRGASGAITGAPIFILRHWQRRWLFRFTLWFRGTLR